MAALASHAPPPTAPPALELIAAGDAWTAEEIDTARDLCAATDASDARFLLGDWLLGEGAHGRARREDRRAQAAR
jgi:hypothetical protein